MRRNMLASELSISLRRQMLWERHQGVLEKKRLSGVARSGDDVSVGRRKRSHSV